MKGAITGDIIGSTYEWNRIKHKEFDLFPKGTDFTDDTVLTIALADAILNNLSYKESIHAYARSFPERGYGGMFLSWIGEDDPQPYNSFGNGSAMRVSAVGFAFNTEQEVLHHAAESARPSHNHPEGIKGAQAVALSIFLARMGACRYEIKKIITDKFEYDLSGKLDEIRPGYDFNETCQGTVPAAITAFLESICYEDAIRNAISLGGDSDTLACIAGGIAEAYYRGVPEEIEKKALSYLDSRLMKVVEMFYERFVNDGYSVKPCRE